MFAAKRIVTAVVASAFLSTATVAWAQTCSAPSTWFPHASTPEPDSHSPTSSCEFHQWGWQTFLWLTQTTSPGRIRLLDLPMARDLFTPGRAPQPLTPQLLEKLKQQPLILTPRVTKKVDPTTFEEIHQAGSRGLLIDEKGRSIYYASHVNSVFYDFVRNNQYFLKEKYVAAPPATNFPVKSLELKSSWRIVPADEKADGFFTYTALIHPLTCKNGANNCTGTDVVVDTSRTEKVTVALVGIHIVGVVEDHPEFIWATFEHKNNAPDLPAGMLPNSPNPVSAQAWTFYAANTAAQDCNLGNAGTVAFNATTNTLSPRTHIFRHFPFGGGSMEDTQNIQTLNQSVHTQLAPENSVWGNYFLVGGVWFANGGALVPGLDGSSIQAHVVGSVRISNATMESFTQATKKNCFACHHTGAGGGLPAMNMNLSHILKDGLLERDELVRMAMSAKGFGTAPLKNYADVQAFFDEFVRVNGIDLSGAPHGYFWRQLTHSQFVNGDMPGVIDPATGNPIKMLVSGDSANSNIIMSLQGKAGTIFDPVTGNPGRMPPNGPFMSTADIARLADWIDRNCPN